MSALGMATLGVQCENKALGMASLGVFCGVVLLEDNLGGSQFRDNPFIFFQPILHHAETEMPVGKEVVPFLQLSDVDVEVDGKKYQLVSTRSPTEFINSFPNAEKLIKKTMEKTGKTRRKVKKQLFDEVMDRFKQVEAVKSSVFSDDEEIIMILVATDDI